ncbi:MAG: cupin domain-containing protein [Deferrisomatales bacterium]
MAPEAPRSEVIRLVDHVPYAEGAIVSKTLVDKKAGTVTLFAFDAGQNLSEHTAPFDAAVQVLDGEATLVVGGKTLRPGAGELVIMPAHVPHSVRAERRFKMLLTLIRS